MSSCIPPAPPRVERTPSSSAPSTTSKPRRRFVGSSTRPSRGGGPKRTGVVPNAIPEDILNNEELNEAVKALPSNYSFEIHKTIHQLLLYRIKTVALQLPEGLLIYGPIIADILESFTSVQPLLLADVTYGACCIDDYTAKSMGAEMIVHYGHSCLIPVSQTTLRTLYVFVEILIDPLHLSLSIRRNFPSSRNAFRRAILSSTTEGKSDSGKETGAKLQIGLEVQPSVEGKANDDDDEKPTRLALVSTIQFISAVQDLRDALSQSLPPISDPNTKSPSSPSTAVETTSQPHTQSTLLRARAEEIGVWRGKYDVLVPQVRPLSPGEVLGCTAPKLDDGVDALIYIGDGRFHLESIMIANPSIPAFRYDPYDKKFTREGYNHDEMRKLRGESVMKARGNLSLQRRAEETESEESLDGNEGAGGWAVILGTLGRQGSLSVLNTIKQSLPRSLYPPFLLLLSELSPQKLDLLPISQLSTFVQTSCPRLSIDWGYAFSRPLLSPYEASVAIGRAKGWQGLDDGDDDKLQSYPMDFYSDDSLGPWTPRHGMGRPVRPVRAT